MSHRSAPTYTHRRRRRAFLSLLACRSSLLREAMPLSNFGPALPSSRALLFCGRCGIFIQNVFFWVKEADLPCARRMADMSVPSLLERLGTHIFGRSMRRRTASSSRGPVFPDTGFEPNLLPWFRSKRQTAFPPPSSGCHHFHKAPSSDGASFFVLLAVGMGGAYSGSPDPCTKQGCSGWRAVRSAAEERPSICAWLAFPVRVCRTRRHPA